MTRNKPQSTKSKTALLAVGTIMMLFTSITVPASNAFASSTDPTSPMMSSVTLNFLKDAWNSTKKAVSDAWDWTKEAFSDAWDWCRSNEYCSKIVKQTICIEGTFSGDSVEAEWCRSSDIDKSLNFNPSQFGTSTQKLIQDKFKDLGIPTASGPNTRSG